METTLIYPPEMSTKDAYLLFLERNANRQIYKKGEDIHFWCRDNFTKSKNLYKKFALHRLPWTCSYLWGCLDCLYKQAHPEDMEKFYEYWDFDKLDSLFELISDHQREVRRENKKKKQQRRKDKRKKPQTSG